MITPRKNTHSFTQASPTKVLQKYSQRTPLKKRTLNTQTVSSTSSVGAMAIPETRNKSCGKNIEFKEKSTQISAPPMNISMVKYNDVDIKKFTGFQTYALFNIVFNYVNSGCSEENCSVDSHSTDPSQIFPNINPENQFYLVLNKLWRNPTDEMLAMEFGVSIATVSRLFISGMSACTGNLRF